MRLTAACSSAAFYATVPAKFNFELARGKYARQTTYPFELGFGGERETPCFPFRGSSNSQEISPTHVLGTWRTGRRPRGVAMDHVAVAAVIINTLQLQEAEPRRPRAGRQLFLGSVVCFAHKKLLRKYVIAGRRTLTPVVD